MPAQPHLLRLPCQSGKRLLRRLPRQSAKILPPDNDRNSVFYCCDSDSWITAMLSIKTAYIPVVAINKRRLSIR